MTISTSAPPARARRPSTPSEEQTDRLRGARFAASGHVRFRRAGPVAREPRVQRIADRRFHRQGTFARGGCSPAHLGPQRGGQGRRIAGTPAGRDGLVPASSHLYPAPRKAEDARSPASLRRSAGRQEGARRRRRRAQYLRAEQRAGTPRNERANRRDGPRGDSRRWNRLRIWPSS